MSEWINEMEENELLIQIIISVKTAILKGN